MKNIITIVAMFSLGSIAGVNAAPVQLADGTTIEGQLGQPAEVIVHTANGERRVAFAALAPEVQRLYWQKPVETAAAPVKAAPVLASATTLDEDLAALANEVNLSTWEQIASMASFRDRAEKRGSGGLVVTKGANALSQTWVSVYSPKDPVGVAGNWDAQVTKARALQERSTQFIQKRWLDLFIQAGEAVAKRDSDEFAAAVREFKRWPLAVAAIENSQNFFTAK